MQTTLQLLYKTISGSKKKERFETILEPLQALIQIALLSYYPIGSKITIQNNILYIQSPSYSQSVTRWYNNDTQEDLFYLFNIFCRFKKFYMDIKVEHAKLFELLISLAKNGINNLIRTYNQTDKTHVLHTLQMYKNMLDGTVHSYNHHVIATPVSMVTELNHSPSPSSSSLSNTNIHGDVQLHIRSDNRVNTHDNKCNKNKNGFHDKKNKIPRTDNDNNDNVSLESTDNEKLLNKKELNTIPMSSFTSSAASPEIDMDTIFIKISDLYTHEIFEIIYNAFIEMGRDDTNYMDYANGLNMMLHPINIRIKKWIDENIVF